jgi:hypothetical protein
MAMVPYSGPVDFGIGDGDSRTPVAAVEPPGRG